MKKLLLVVMALLTALSFTGCSPGMTEKEILDTAEMILESQGKIIVDEDEYNAMVEMSESEVISEPSGPADENTTDTEAENPVSIGAFDADLVISQLETTEYKLDTRYSHIAYLVVKNNSDFNLQIAVTASFYDAEGNLIGSNTQDEYGFESGYELAFEFYNEDEFESVEYDYWVDDETWYDCVLSSLAVEVDTTDDKAILTITNNGDKAAMFVEYYVLFFAGDTLVYSGWGYCVDGDSEIKPGKSQRVESESYENFDNVLVYISGRAE